MPVNIGNPDEVTIRQAADEVIEISRKLGAKSAANSEVELVPMPEENADDPKVRKPDITRAETLLGWQPEVPRHEGFTQTVQYFIDKESG